MFLSKNHEQTILEIAQGDYIAITAESFLIDRQAGEFSKKSLKFYKQFLKFFFEHCDANSLKQIREVTPDFLRRYILGFSETHNPADWKNPMQKVKAPKVNIDPLEPISLEDVRKLIDICQPGSFTGERDKSIFLFLLDIGARAQEVCNTNINDIDLNAGSVMIRYGKGGKSRMVFMGRKTRRTLRSYLRTRKDRSPALFISRKDGERLAYDGLPQLLDRRAALAKPEKKPVLHGFRRAFALNMLRSGVDIFTWQKLMGLADLQVLRRYLAQNDQDNLLAHMKGGPVDKNL